MVNNFAALIKEVIRPKKCVLCGACVAACPVEAIEIRQENPVLTGVCVNCEVCYYQCPRTSVWSMDSLEKAKFGRKRREDELFGIYIKAYKARAKNREILEAAQNGGVVTALLKYLFDEGLIEGASVVRRDENWEAYVHLARTFQEALKAAGSKYQVVPVHIGVREGVEYGFMESLAFIGLPCQIESLTNYRYSMKSALKLGERVRIAIGVFCYREFDHKKMLNFYREKGINLGEVTKMEIEKGRFKMFRGNQMVLNVKISEIKENWREACKICRDFSAELADISVGNVDTPSDWSTVIIRSDNGLKVFNDAVKKGYIEVEPLEELKLTSKLSMNKRKEADNYIKSKFEGWSDERKGKP